MHRMQVRWSVLLSLFLSFTVSACWAQPGNSPASPPSQGTNSSASQPKNVIRANTRLVILDVVATDDKGEPITGLKAEDFSALEDGKPQTISDFTFHHPAESTAPARQLPPEIASNAPAYTSN